jgi:hypothetical protein
LLAVAAFQGCGQVTHLTTNANVLLQNKNLCERIAELEVLGKVRFVSR